MTFDINEFIVFDIWYNPNISKLPDSTTSFYQIIYGNYNDGDFAYLLPEEMTKISPVMREFLGLDGLLLLGVV
jgi:hypothetical protein